MLVYSMAIWYILWSFGVLIPFWYDIPRKVWQPWCSIFRWAWIRISFSLRIIYFQNIYYLRRKVLDTFSPQWRKFVQSSHTDVPWQAISAPTVRRYFRFDIAGSREIKTYFYLFGAFLTMEVDCLANAVLFDPQSVEVIRLRSIVLPRLKPQIAFWTIFCHVYMCTYVCIYVCMYLCMYICMYMFVHRKGTLDIIGLVIKMFRSLFEKQEDSND
jgi:hypothetical protein